MTAIVADTLNGVGGRLRSLRLGGTIGCWLPNPYGIVGSFETEFIVLVSGSGEAKEEIKIASFAFSHDSCVESRTAGVFFRAGLPSSVEHST